MCIQLSLARHIDYSLRDYSLPPVLWPSVSYAPMIGLPLIHIPGCDPDCDHVWGEHTTTERKQTKSSDSAHLPGYKNSFRSEKRIDHKADKTAKSGQFCLRCGGWRGHLGLEPDIEMFVGHIVLIWRELWRVLHPTGTCWMNIADSYTTKSKSTQDGMEPQTWTEDGKIKKASMTRAGTIPGLDGKNLMGQPWRLAFALQADGWILRSDIIWAKGVSFNDKYSGSVMPESCRDRPTTSHEHVFLLAKSQRYFYDLEGIKEKGGSNLSPRAFGGMSKARHNHDRNDYLYKGDSGTRNVRTVWTIGTKGFRGAHFAVFPTALVEPMIKASTSRHGACAKCGAQWKRVVEQTEIPQEIKDQFEQAWQQTRLSTGRQDGHTNNKPTFKRESKTVGWEPTCDCGCDEVVRPIVLEPFWGSGTTSLVAEWNNCDSIGCELSEEYVKLGTDRIINDNPMFNQVEVIECN